MANPLALHVTCQGDVTVICVGGDVDLSTAPELLACIDAAAQHHRRIELDFTTTTFMDSSGIGCLVEAHRATQANEATLSIIATSPQVDRVLRLAGVAGLLGGPAPSDEE